VARRPERRELTREVVAGSPAVVTVDNIRRTYLSLAEARDYVLSGVGFRVRADADLYAIVRTTYIELPPTRRRGWETLAASTKRGYSQNKQFRAEARAHQMSVEEYYAVVPDLKTARRHGGKGRRTAGPVFPSEENFTVYIARDYRNVAKERQRALSRTTRAAIRRRRREIPDPTWMTPPPGFDEEEFE